jgi:hypothetical protein
MSSSSLPVTSSSSTWAPAPGASPATSSSAASDSHLQKAAAWNSIGADDPLAAVQRYLQGKSTVSAESLAGASPGGAADDGGVAGKKRPATTPLTIQQKKLATTNTKGMKSMASYFGK